MIANVYGSVSEFISQEIDIVTKFLESYGIGRRMLEEDLARVLRPKSRWFSEERLRLEIARRHNYSSEYRW